MRNCGNAGVAGAGGVVRLLRTIAILGAMLLLLPLWWTIPGLAQETSPDPVPDQGVATQSPQRDVLSLLVDDGEQLIQPFAIPPTCPTCHIGTDYGGSGWAGNYSLNGVIGYCVDPNMWYPVGNVFTPQGAGSDGYAMAFGWLLNWYDNPSQDEAVAISMLTALHSPQFGGAGTGIHEQWNSFPHLQGQANWMWSQADAYAGPYSIGSAHVYQQPSHENGAKLSVVFNLTNSKGNLPFGVKREWFEVSGSTNLTDIYVEQNGTSGEFWVGATVVDTSQPWRLDGRPTDWAPGGVQVWKAPAGSMMQDFISKTWATPGDPGYVEGPALMFRPAITTQTSSVLVGASGSLTDQVIITGEPGMAGMEFTGRTRLFGPFLTNAEALSAEVAGRTPVGVAEFTGTYDETGNASFTSAPVAYTQLGFYVWVEELDATDRALGAVQELSGRVTETTLATTPRITSVISTDRIANGSTVADTVNLAGLAPVVGDAAVTWTLTGGLYGPIVAGADGLCTSADWSTAKLTTPVSRVVTTAEISPDGTATLTNLGATKVNADGAARCVSYGWKLTGTAPDGSTSSAVHPVGDPTQTGVITFQPNIITQAQTQLISAELLPMEIADLVTVFDGIEGRSFRGRTVLYGPFATTADAMSYETPTLDDDGSETLGDDEISKLVGISTFDGVFGPGGTAEFYSDPVTVTKFGHYVWVEELFTTADGGEPVNPSEPVQPCVPVDPTEPTEPGEPVDPTEPSNPTEPCEPDRLGRPTESLVVVDATIATQISDQSAERGSTISDTAKITGLVTRVGDGLISWSTDIQLFGPVVPNAAGNCEDLNWADAELVQSTTIAITEDMLDEFGGVTLSGVGEFAIPELGERGCYTYGETLTGTAPDGSVAEFVHHPGNPTQTTLVPATRTVPATGAVGSFDRMPGIVLAGLLLAVGLVIGIVGLRQAA